MAGYVKWSIFPRFVLYQLVLLAKKDIFSHEKEVTCIIMLPALSFPVATETAVRKLYNQGGQQGGVFWFYQNRLNIVTRVRLRYYRTAIIDYLSSRLMNLSTSILA